MIRYFEITPGDAWFFRDARPFNQADPAQMAVPSLFPPNPTTVVGLLRAALARRRGWSGSGKWETAITDILGDGDNLGKLRFSGPYVRSGVDLFPAPTILFGRRKHAGCTQVWEDLVLLTPGPNLRSDLTAPPVRLPIFAEKRCENPDPLFGGCYLTAEAMSRVLAGHVPDKGDIVERDSIAAPEPRVRLEISDTSGTAKPGLLFATEFVRPAVATTLIVGIDCEEDLGDPCSPMAFGGENRWAWIEDGPAEIGVLDMPELTRADNGEVLYTAILLTLGDLDPWPKPGERLDKLPGQVVSAALDRPLRPGEWRSEGARRGPQESPPLLPAGSTWFLRAPANQEDEIRKWCRQRIGRRTEWGFGEVAIGTWRDAVAPQEETP